jgi:hypothetical protein
MDNHEKEGRRDRSAQRRPFGHLNSTRPQTGVILPVACGPEF